MNKDIRDYYKMVFSSAIGGQEEIEADVRMEELVAKLNGLKDNLEDEKRLILHTHAAMSKLLTPKYLYYFIILIYDTYFTLTDKRLC